MTRLFLLTSSQLIDSGLTILELLLLRPDEPHPVFYVKLPACSSRPGPLILPKVNEAGVSAAVPVSRLKQRCRLLGGPMSSRGLEWAHLVSSLARPSRILRPKG